MAIGLTTSLASTPINAICLEIACPIETAKDALEQEEYERRRTQNLCYKCGVSDYISRQCPERNHVPTASGSNHPPGRSNHNIELSATQHTENLRELAETTEDLSTLNIGMMNITNEGNSMDDYVMRFNKDNEEDDSDTAFFSVLSHNKLFNELDHMLEYHSEENKGKIALNERIADMFKWLSQCHAAQGLTSVLMTEEYSYIPGFYNSAGSLYSDQVRRMRYQWKLGRHEIHTRMGDMYHAKLLASLNFYSRFIQYKGSNFSGRLSSPDEVTLPRFLVKGLKADHYEIQDVFGRFTLRMKEKHV
ncbi:hypothetical protein NP233_g6422 [Leucocoprinus birnbaumii]|uniref:Uncharacterized protein n=1 Tax=Leucocoprinus birnbaumii TaxID=56174 RepID=A0AAD5VR66_9AGAR|nr:hypothetical protein NP233_g6422 [Leucocoprinus birnbaumii]